MLIPERRCSTGYAVPLDVPGRHDEPHECTAGRSLGTPLSEHLRSRARQAFVGQVCQSRYIGRTPYRVLQCPPSNPFLNRTVPSVPPPSGATHASRSIRRRVRPPAPPHDPLGAGSRERRGVAGALPARRQPLEQRHPRPRVRGPERSDAAERPRALDQRRAEWRHSRVRLGRRLRAYHRTHAGGGALRCRCARPPLPRPRRRRWPQRPRRGAVDGWRRQRLVGELLRVRPPAIRPGTRGPQWRPES